MGYVSDLGFMPANIGTQVLLSQVRDKSGRLTEYGTQLKTANQNAAIKQAEKLARRTMTPAEKIEIIARVQKEFDLVGLRDSSGRLNDRGIQVMTQAQNAAITRAESMSGKKLSPNEKFDLIKKVQANYGVNNKVEYRWSPGMKEFAGALETFIKEVAWRSTYGLPNSVGLAIGKTGSGIITAGKVAVDTVVERLEKEGFTKPQIGLGAGIASVAVLAIGLMYFLRPRQRAA